LESLHFGSGIASRSNGTDPIAWRYPETSDSQTIDPIDQSQYDPDHREPENRRACAIAWYDERSNHCRCGPDSSRAIPIADHVPIANDCSRHKRFAGIPILSDFVQPTDAITEELKKGLSQK